MAVTTDTPVARDGWLLIWLCIGLGALVAYWQPWAASPFILLAVYLSWLFRDPARIVPSSPLALITPVDAVVEKIEQTTDPYRDTACIRIVLNMHRSGAYVVHSVTEGKILQHWYARHAQHTHAFWIQTDEKDDVIIELQPGRYLRRLNCRVAAGERVGQGQRCGFIPFGAKVVVYIPEGSRVQVKEGQAVTGATDILAMLVRR